MQSDTRRSAQIPDIGLLIFDECHKCTKGHPYNQVMQQYHTCAGSERPDILGLTARRANPTLPSRGSRTTDGRGALRAGVARRREGQGGI